MKKIINKPENYVDEMLAGLCACHPDLVLHESHHRVVRARHSPGQGRVGIVSGGGSGHLPLFTGYVGKGLIDACAIGNVFEGPTVDSCMEAIRAADGGRGVLRLYGNYGGDRMNFDLAGEMLEGEIETTTVLGTDDVASAKYEQREKRRGVAGLIYAYKTAGAAADEGAELAEVTRVAAKTVERCRTIGCGLSPCEIPGVGKPTFSIAEDEIEMGIGIHGEPGIWRAKLPTADEIAQEMISRLLADAPPPSGRVSVLINSLGATPLEELFIVYRKVREILVSEQMDIVKPLVGPYTTSMEMAGLSISLLFLDDELERLLQAPAECPFWRV